MVSVNQHCKHVKTEQTDIGNYKLYVKATVVIVIITDGLRYMALNKCKTMFDLSVDSKYNSNKSVTLTPANINVRVSELSSSHVTDTVQIYQTNIILCVTLFGVVGKN